MKNNITEEKVQEIVEKNKGLSGEEVAELIRETMEDNEKKRVEKMDAVTEFGIKKISERLLNGYSGKWYCNICGDKLDTFKGEDGISKIKEYIKRFNNDLFRECKNKHINWFEITENGLIWRVQASFEDSFKKKNL